LLKKKQNLSEKIESSEDLMVTMKHPKWGLLCF